MPMSYGGRPMPPVPNAVSRRMGMMGGSADVAPAFTSYYNPGPMPNAAFPVANPMAVDPMAAEAPPPIPTPADVRQAREPATDAIGGPAAAQPMREGIFTSLYRQGKRMGNVGGDALMGMSQQQGGGPPVGNTAVPPPGFRYDESGALSPAAPEPPPEPPRYLDNQGRMSPPKGQLEPGEDPRSQQMPKGRPSMPGRIGRRMDRRAMSPPRGRGGS